MAAGGGGSRVGGTCVLLLVLRTESVLEVEEKEGRVSSSLR